MKKTYFVALMSVVAALGCARIRVEAPKEPIKVDVSMRVDIYQHIQKDIDAIEDIVSGSGSNATSSGQHSMLHYFIGTAYAQEELDPAVKEAALRRKARLSLLYSLMDKGIIGENKSGLLTIIDTSTSDSSVEKIVNEENGDRMIIYRGLAGKNNTTLEDIQKLYASRLQNDAPAGTPVEVLNEAIGIFGWQKK